MSDRTYLRRLVITIAVLAFTITLWWLRLVILLIFASVVLAILIRSLSNPIREHVGVQDGVAVAGAVTTLAMLTFGVLAIFGWRMAGQFTQLLDLLPMAFSHFLEWLKSQPFGARIVASFRQSGGGSAMGAILHLPTYALLFLGGAADVLLVMAGGIYLSYKPALYQSAFLQFLPTTERTRAAIALKHAGHRLRMWLLSQLAAMVLVGSMVALGTWALGVPAAGALGLLAGAVEFVPIIGPVISAIPAFLLALLVGVDTAAWTILLFIAIQQLEGNLVIPLLQQRAVSLPPMVTLFGLVAFGTIFGPLGVLLATPLSLISAEIMRYGNVTKEDS